MMYSGDEDYEDEITSGIFPEDEYEDPNDYDSEADSEVDIENEED